ncbi:CD1871A family CXXC motif-containing protein [Frisingicoccus sp.]|jgi:hypothetical protein
MIKKKETLLSLVLLAAGVLCMCLGIYRGEVKTVFEKAINICLECIGIG